MGNLQLHPHPHPDLLTVGWLEIWLSPSGPCLAILAHTVLDFLLDLEMPPMKPVLREVQWLQSSACWQKSADCSYPETQSLEGALRYVKVRGRPSNFPSTLGLWSLLLGTQGSSWFMIIKALEILLKSCCFASWFCTLLPAGCQETLLSSFLAAWQKDTKPSCRPCPTWG